MLTRNPNQLKVASFSPKAKTADELSALSVAATAKAMADDEFATTD